MGANDKLRSIYGLRKIMVFTSTMIHQRNRQGVRLGVSLGNQGFHSMRGPTFYRKTSRTLEAARFGFRHFQPPCRDACQILERHDHYNIQPRGFETSRGLAIRRLTAKRIEAGSQLSIRRRYNTHIRYSDGESSRTPLQWRHRSIMTQEIILALICVIPHGQKGLTCERFALM